MGIFDKLRGEFIDIIEWTQPNDSDILVYRFPRYNNEIKMGAKLTVREGQAAIFVNEGRIADVFTPGMYTLSTSNLPILSTIMGWKYGFDSPFKSEIYFVVTSQKTDRKWGTSNPIMKRDSDFGMVRLRAFGTYVFKVTDPAAFLRELVATDPSFEAYEIDSQLRQVIQSKFADTVGKASMPVLDLVGNYETMANYVLQKIRPDFNSWGIEVTKFYIENISLPPEVEAAIDKRGVMGAVGDMNRYTQYQAAEAMRDAANNPSGGAAGVGVGLGAGMAMGEQMRHAMSGAGQPGSPPPIPGGSAQVMFHVAINSKQSGPFDLNTLQQKIAAGEISRESLVWKPGMASWSAASSVAELSGLFASAPPPLPK